MWDEVELDLDNGLRREALQERNLLEEIHHLLFLLLLKALHICHVVVFVDRCEVGRPGGVN